MPVHSREKKENNHDEMEVDYGENEGSSSEEEETESSSVSEEGDSSGTAAARRAAPLREAPRPLPRRPARCPGGETGPAPRLRWLPVPTPSVTPPPRPGPARRSPCSGPAAPLRAGGEGRGWWGAWARKPPFGPRRRLWSRLAPGLGWPGRSAPRVVVCALLGLSAWPAGRGVLAKVCT